VRNHGDSPPPKVDAELLIVGSCVDTEGGRLRLAQFTLIPECERRSFRHE